MQPPTYIINTFTAPNLTGNPTAVCCITGTESNDELQTIATHLAYPVTAFIHKSEDNFAIKYFTPTTQIPACGHATLAAAKVAQLEGTVNPSFKTANNILIDTSAENDVIMMSYPKYNSQKIEPEAELLESLQITAYKSAGFCPELETIFIELDDPQTLKSIQPDFETLTLAGNKQTQKNVITKEVVITSVSDVNQYDFFLRSFCPWIGINEDPVTGSVHSVLAGFWSSRLNKHELKAYQASARGGEIIVRNHADKVEIGGRMTIIQTSLQHEVRSTNNQR